jgi:lysozyme
MQISPTGLELIVRFEGLRLTAYDDGFGTWTIGCGHTGPDVHRGLSCTRPRAMQLLQQDVRGAEASIARLVHVPLNQCQFDALTSLVFNAGSGPLHGTLGQKLNARDYAGAAQEFLRWNKANVHGRLEVSLGLVRRREAEKTLFEAAPVVHDLTQWLTEQERAWVTEYDALIADDKRDPARVQAIREAMRRDCKVIWRHAQPHAQGGDGHGWHFRHRIERYLSLSARTDHVPPPPKAVAATVATGAGG